MLVASFLLASMAVQEPQAAAAPCTVDRRAMMALDHEAFDQDPRNGWRALYDRPGCREAAADLIAMYRDRTEARARSLAWHEGQLRAEIGQIGEAIELMNRARRPPMLWGISQNDWNSYVDATVAFLRGDRRRLLRARARLAAHPVPENYRWLDADGREQVGRPPDWPLQSRRGGPSDPLLRQRLCRRIPRRLPALSAARPRCGRLPLRPLLYQLS